MILVMSPNTASMTAPKTQVLPSSALYAPCACSWSIAPSRIASLSRMGVRPFVRTSSNRHASLAAIEVGVEQGPALGPTERPIIEPGLERPVEGQPPPDVATEVVLHGAEGVAARD